jgi:5-methylcytosine-specific restriction endonuclease McrA
MTRQYPSSQWRERRELVLERDERTCQNCGTSATDLEATLHVHHKTPVTDGGSDDLSNLVTLCPSCHRGLHADSRSEYVTLDVVEEIVRQYHSPVFTHRILSPEVPEQVAKNRLNRLVERGDLIKWHEQPIWDSGYDEGKQWRRCLFYARPGTPAENVRLFIVPEKDAGGERRFDAIVDGERYYGIATSAL